MLQCMSLVLCRFLDAVIAKPVARSFRPASKKRQGTKSRSVVQRRCGGALWGFGRGSLFEEVRPGQPSCSLYLKGWVGAQG
jgi:hypothetical protein